jgi:predicted small lipoprotein YifL
MLGFTAMSRQSICACALRAVAIAVLAASIGACGIKGPLRPPPKGVPAETPAPPNANPATPPATTSPALPPPSAPGDR